MDLVPMKPRLKAAKDSKVIDAITSSEIVRELWKKRGSKIQVTIKLTLANQKPAGGTGQNAPTTLPIMKPIEIQTNGYLLINATL
jgi:hypothetical protein